MISLGSKYESCSGFQLAEYQRRIAAADKNAIDRNLAAKAKAVPALSRRRTKGTSGTKKGRKEPSEFTKVCYTRNVRNLRFH